MPLNTEIQLVSSTRSDTANADIYRRYDTINTYYDGVAQLSMGPGVAKIEMFRTKGIQEIDGKSVEIREVEETITLPTVAFLEFIANSFEITLNASETLDTAMKNAIEHIRSVAERIKSQA